MSEQKIDIEYDKVIPYAESLMHILGVPSLRKVYYDSGCGTYGLHLIFSPYKYSTCMGAHNMGGSSIGLNSVIADVVMIPDNLVGEISGIDEFLSKVSDPALDRYLIVTNFCTDAPNKEPDYIWIRHPEMFVSPPLESSNPLAKINKPAMDFYSGKLSLKQIIERSLQNVVQRGLWKNDDLDE